MIIYTNLILGLFAGTALFMIVVKIQTINKIKGSVPKMRNPPATPAKRIEPGMIMYLEPEPMQEFPPEIDCEFCGASAPGEKKHNDFACSYCGRIKIEKNSLKGQEYMGATIKLPDGIGNEIIEWNNRQVDKRNSFMDEFNEQQQNKIKAIMDKLCKENGINPYNNG